MGRFRLRGSRDNLRVEGLLINIDRFDMIVGYAMYIVRNDSNLGSVVPLGLIEGAGTLTKPSSMLKLRVFEPFSTCCTFYVRNVQSLRFC
jgi:hypothetical protein